MGKTILVAIFAAVLTSIATTLVMQSIADDQARQTEALVEKAEQRAIDAEERVKSALDRLDRFGERVRRTEIAVGEAQQNAMVAVQAAGAEATSGEQALKSPDGTPYVSRAELDELLASRPALTAEDVSYTPVERKSVEEIADDMGLTSQQASTLRVLIRDWEQEMVNLLFGNRPVGDVVADIERAKDDPDLQAEMMQSMLMRGVGNAGKLMTAEKRLRQKVEGVLGEEQASEFLSKPRKPVLDASLEDIFEGLVD